jgi:hypothetical protein
MNLNFVCFLFNGMTPRCQFTWLIVTVIVRVLLPLQFFICWVSCLPELGILLEVINLRPLRRGWSAVRESNQACRTEGAR